MKKTNRPEKGSTIWIEPIRTMDDIRRITCLLADRPRDLAMFLLGISTSLHARDLLRLMIGQVRRVKPGDRLTIHESKSGNPKCVTITRAVHDVLRDYLDSIQPAGDTDFLFKSQKGGGVLGMSYFNRRVKSWCREVCLEGNFGSQTLRKTFGYMKIINGEIDIAELMVVFGHFNRKQTADYLGVAGSREEYAKRERSGCIPCLPGNDVEPRPLSSALASASPGADKRIATARSMKMPPSP